MQEARLCCKEPPRLTAQRCRHFAWPLGPCECVFAPFIGAHEAASAWALVQEAVHSLERKSFGEEGEVPS